jgi:Lon protease-like protein
MFVTILRTKNVPDDWTTAYTPNARDRELAKDDVFLKKKIFQAMNERSKLMADWKSVQPKMSSYLISALTEASISAIQEKERLEWTNALQKDDTVAMMEIIVRCVTSTGNMAVKLRVTAVIEELLTL